MDEGEVLGLSIKDFFTKQMLQIALFPLIFTMIIMFILFFAVADYGLIALKEFIAASQNNENILIDPNAPFYFVWITTIVSFLFSYSITSWLVSFLVYTIGSIFILMFSVFLTLIIIGFLTPAILRVLHKRHYSHLKTNGFGNILSSVWLAVKSVIIMIILFIVLIPLYFVPVINIVAINFPFYYFFHKLLNYDVVSTILTEEEFKVIHKKSANAFRLRTMFLYFLSMIPSLMLFTAVFFIIYLGHSYFQELQKLREIELNVSEIKQDKKLLE